MAKKLSGERRIAYAVSALIATLSGGLKNTSAISPEVDMQKIIPIYLQVSHDEPDSKVAFPQNVDSDTPAELAQQEEKILTAEFPTINLSPDGLEYYQQLWQEIFPDISLSKELQQKKVVELPFALDTELPSDLKETEDFKSILKLRTALYDLVITNAPNLDLPVESLFQLRLVLSMSPEGTYQLITVAETRLDFPDLDAGSVLFRTPGNETWRYIEKTEKDDGVGFLVADEQTVAEATQYMVVMPPPSNKSGYLEFQPGQLFLGGWRNSPAGDRVIVNSALLSESALDLEASRQQWAGANGVAFDPQTDVITATPPAVNRAPGHAIEVAPPEITEDWLSAENFAETQLAQPLIDVLNARDEAAKLRDLTPKDFKALQIGNLPIVLDYGLKSEADKRKEWLLNDLEYPIDEFIIVPHHLVDDYLNNQLPEFIKTIPRETILTLNPQGETIALDTSTLTTTPQIIIKHRDLSDFDKIPGINSRVMHEWARSYYVRVYDPQTNVITVYTAPAYGEVSEPYSYSMAAQVLVGIMSAFTNDLDKIHGDLSQISRIGETIVPFKNNSDVGFTFIAPKAEFDLLNDPRYSQYQLVD